MTLATRLAAAHRAHAEAAATLAALATPGAAHDAAFARSLDAADAFRRLVGEVAGMEATVHGLERENDHLRSLIEALATPPSGPVLGPDDTTASMPAVGKETT